MRAALCGLALCGLALCGLAVVAACGGGGGFPDAAGSLPPVAPGTVAIDWTLSDGSNASISCDQAGATTVHVGIVDPASGAQFSASFPCDLGGGVTGALASTTYDLRFELLGSAGELATAAAQPGIVVRPDKTTSIGALSFVVETAALRDEALALVRVHAPRIDALAARIAALKHDLRGNLPGWEGLFRVAQLANDELGLSPFEQARPPGPGWTPSPTSLIGMSAYVPARAAELARAGRVAELRGLVTDVRGRFEHGIADVDAKLGFVDARLAALAVDRARARR